MIFNGTDFSEVMIINKVNRPIAGNVINKTIDNNVVDGSIFLNSKREPIYITVSFTLKSNNLSANRRLLSRLCIDEELGELSFSDEPNIFYKAKIDGNVKFEEGDYHAVGEMIFIVPDSVGYNRELTTNSFGAVNSINLINNGTDYAYPVFEFAIKSKTYMVGLTSHLGSYQYGETLEVSELNNLEIKDTPTQGYVPAKRTFVAIDDLFKNNPGNWGNSYDMTPVNSAFVTNGTFVSSSTTAKGPVNGKITVSTSAVNWQTGEKIANFVKGNTYAVDGQKAVNQSRSKIAYRIKDDKGVYLGWILEEDIEGQNNFNNGAIVPNYGTVIANKWHGPARDKTFTGNPTDWKIEVSAIFNMGTGSQYGKLYFGIASGLRPLFGCVINADQAHKFAELVIITRGGNLKFDQDPNNNFFTNFKGTMSITKEGKRVTFEFKNLSTGKTISQSYQTYQELAEMEANRVLLWGARYSNLPTISELGFESVKVTGYDSDVFVNDTAPDVQNLPNPKTYLSAGDVVRIDMNNNKAYVNGIESNNDVAYGSKTIKIKPGTTEVIVSSDCAGAKPTIETFFRERFI